MLPLSFRTKTNIAIALVMMTLAVVGYLAFRQTKRLISGEKWVSHSRDVLDADASLCLHLSQAVGARRGYLLTGHSGEIGLLANEGAAAQSDLENLRALTADNPAQQQRMRTLASLIQTRLALLKQSVDLHGENLDGKDRTAQESLSKQGGDLAEQISETQRSFHETEAQLLIQRLMAAADADRKTLQAETLLVAVVFAVLIAGLIFVNREITLRRRAEDDLAEKERLLRSVLNSTGDLILVADCEGKIILRNAAAARYHLRVPEKVAPENWAAEFGVYQSDKTTLVPATELPLARAALHGETVDNVEVYVRPPGWDSGRWHLASARPLLDGAGRRRGGIVILRDVTERKFLEEDRDRLVVELYKSLSKVKTLTGLLPICAGCKKVRDDKGYWTQVEDYVSKHSEVKFSHGLCPDCVAGLYPEVAQKKDSH
jgi:CHASE3 domain sensor protein